MDQLLKLDLFNSSTVCTAMTPPRLGEAGGGRKVILPNMVPRQNFKNI
jgi:hypothetical protein